MSFPATPTYRAISHCPCLLPGLDHLFAFLEPPEPFVQPRRSLTILPCVRDKTQPGAFFYKDLHSNNVQWSMHNFYSHISNNSVLSIGFYSFTHRVGSCTTSLSVCPTLYIINWYIFWSVFYFFNTGSISSFLIGDVWSPGTFGPTDFKNYCIVACEYWYFLYLRQLRWCKFLRTWCVARFLINELFLFPSLVKQHLNKDFKS